MTTRLSWSLQTQPDPGGSSVPSSPSSLPPPRFRFGEEELLSDLAGEFRRLSLHSRGVAHRLGGLTLDVGLRSPPGLHILEMDKPRRVLRPASALTPDGARLCCPANCAGRDPDDCCCLGRGHPRRSIEGRVSIVETDVDGLAGWVLGGWTGLYRFGHSVPFREPRSYLVTSATESDHHHARCGFLAWRWRCCRSSKPR